jgi:CBS domain-containing protein
MQVKDIMSSEVVTVEPDDTVEQAAKLMEMYNVGSIPVCEGEQVIGIVTDRDIALRSVAHGNNIRRQRVRDVMSGNPVVGTPDMDAHEAAGLMSRRQVRRLPIVQDNALVGIVALGDISVQPNLQDNAQQALSNISKPDDGQLT